MNPLKCVIAGYGYMGEIRKRVIDKIPELSLIGICDNSKKKLDGITDCKTFDTYNELLDLDPDIVFVCTPNSFSPEICIKSLEMGKHVFCEKPPGRNLQDIADIRAAEGPHSKLMFGFNHRFHPGIIRAKVIIDSGRLGKVIAVRGIYGKSGGKNFKESWRNDINISGGGILLDQGIHMLDLFRYFCGDFNEVKCFSGNKFWKFNAEDNAMVILKNDKEQIATLHSSATQWKHTFKITVILEEGYLIVEGLLSKTGSYGREQITVGKRQFEDESDAVGNPSEEISYFDKDLSWDIEMDEFLKAIREDKPVIVSNSEDAYKVMEIIHKAYIDAGLIPFKKEET